MADQRQVPSVPATSDPVLRNFLSAVREAVNAMSASVANQSSSAGVTSASISALSTTIAGLLDTSTPPAVTGLAVQGMRVNNFVTWNASTYANLSYTEIWRAPALMNASSMTVGGSYTINVLGTTNWSSIGATAPAITALVNGTKYIITALGTINWTSIGLGSNPVVGATFTYNGTAVSGSGGTVLTANFTLNSTPVTGTGGVVVYAPVLSSAVLVGTSNGHIFVDSVDPGSAYAYWVRFVSNANIDGPFNASTGVIGSTSISNGNGVNGYTITAENLYAIQAWISSADILDAAITNAKISGTIQSDNYNGSTLGWSLDKTGGNLNLNQLTIRDGLGNVVLSSGSNPVLSSSVASAAVVNKPNLVTSPDTWTASGVTVISLATAVNGLAFQLPSGVIGGAAVVGSNSLNLSTSTDYTVSFKAWSAVAGTTLQVDLFPDTLPEFSTVLTTTPTIYSYVFNSTVAGSAGTSLSGMANCFLRFFYGAVSAGITTICDIKLEQSSTRTPWIPNILDTKWANITGTGKPADNATKNLVYNQATAPTSPNEGDVWYVNGILSGYVKGALYIYKTGVWVQTADATASQLAGSGINIANPRYCTFEEPNLPPLVSTAGCTVTLDNSIHYFGSKCLKMVATNTDPYTYLSEGPFNVNIAPNKKWIFSCYVYATVTGSGVMYLYTGTHYALSYVISTANTWTRVSGVIDLSAVSDVACAIRLGGIVSAVGSTTWFDGVMLEVQIGNNTTPSVYQEPVNFLNTYIGALDATKNNIYRAVTAPTGGTYTSGDLWFDTDANPPTFYQWDGTTWAIISNAVTNTNQVVDGAGLGTTSLWTGVSGTGKPADNATVGATIGTNLSGQINSSNISTYIANAAITTAQIGNLAVDTLQIAGNAVTVPLAATSASAIGIPYFSAGNIFSLVIPVLSTTNSTQVLIISGGQISASNAANENNFVTLGLYYDTTFIQPIATVLNTIPTNAHNETGCFCLGGILTVPANTSYTIYLKGYKGSPTSGASALTGIFISAVAVKK